MALVTVVIPMYNKGKLVARAIRSILAQTFTDFKLIIVDDGSTDNGPEIVRSFDDPRIDLIQQSNAGPGAARNKGIESANTKYVAFLDADDEWYPWFLENSINAIKKYNVPVVASMFYTLPDGIDSSVFLSNAGLTTGKFILDNSIPEPKADALISFMHPLNIVAKTDTIKEHGGFYHENRCVFGEDQALFIRVCLNEEFALITPPSSRYHCEDSEHGTVEINRPLQPYLAEPDIILLNCPEDRKELAWAILELRAIRTATHMLQRGERESAKKLLNKFPNAKRQKSQYQSYIRKFNLGPVYPVYLKFKKYFINPIRNLRSYASKSSKTVLPLMTNEQDDNDKR
jgi:glycosyltransferase involved in cell wall biosynthesis